MLVLLRRIDEEIVIGDNVSIKVLRFVDGGVRIGIEAPKEVPIRRGELVPHGDESGDKPDSGASAA